MATRTANLFTIPASAPFLPTLIDALLDGALVPGFRAAGDPLAMANATLYLPTRPACRLVRQVFLQRLGQDAAILPRIIAIGGVDEDEIGFAEAANGDISTGTLDLPRPLGGFERNVLLAELILRWANSPEVRIEGGPSLVVSSPAGALMLANDLGRLMDDMTTRQVPWDRLDRLVPENMDEYWQKALRFLQIVGRQWPDILAKRGLIEPAERRNRLIAAEAARLARSNAPVIAAGSTGSIPATAVLLETIANLPHGAVVLPGLDTELEDEVWDMIGGDAEATPGHPQFAMQGLLRRVGVARDAVVTIKPAAPHGRERLLSEALRPASATELWQDRLAAPDFAAHADAALADVSVIEAANAEEEALAIAVALREAVEQLDVTAALVTPDRALARRVLAALARWNVPADDSHGVMLAETPAGVFAQLVAEVGLGGLEPVTLLALLKHPLCRVDARAVAVLERAVLRGPRPQAGTAGLARTLAGFRIAQLKLHPSDPRKTITRAELNLADDLVARLEGALVPLEGLRGRHSFAAIAVRHREAIEALGAASPDLAKSFDEIAEAGRLTIAPGDYAELFRAAIADCTAYQIVPGARVRILGTLESRLHTVDRIVLGGLVEGTWPPETQADPWLSRPMRQALGLDLPERRISLSAHDFAQAIGAREAILSRAAKLGGAPTVASRFVQRLAAVAGETRWLAAVERGDKYLAWARALDAPDRPWKPVPRPEPRPPLAARPNSLSVTEIELWLRDPYSIYARYILGLRLLDAIDTPPGARDRGTLVHGAIGEFTERFRDSLPQDAFAELLQLGDEHFKTLEDFPDAKAFWWPRYLRIAQWFAEFEAARRPDIDKLHAEVPGKLEIPVPNGVFTLRARADRIEQRKDGTYAILDYKTGRTSSAKEVRSGLAPQLTLEGAILRQGKFGEIPKGASIAEFLYVSLRGGQPPGDRKSIEWNDSTPDAQADYALVRLTKVVTEFNNPDMPYRSRERVMFMRRSSDDYDHLSRVKEWSLSSGAADPEDSGGGE